jgi:23S rRNA pseudouridine2605 synthase
MAKKAFDKFINGRSNAAKKEDVRKEKRAAKKEIAEGIIRTKQRKRAAAAEAKEVRKAGGVPAQGRKSTPERKPADNRKPADSRKPADNRKPAQPRKPAPGSRKAYESKKPEERKPRERKPTAPPPRPTEGQPKEAPRPIEARKVTGRKRPVEARRPAEARETSETPMPVHAPKPEAPSHPVERPAATPAERPASRRPGPERAAGPQMPLNKYIAHGGICSRREAADIVKSGVVKVNGKVVTDPGFKILDKDEVKVSGKKVVPTGNLVYILLNKPKDFITTSNDPEGRKTVLDLVRKATDERIFPIGRLDRNTTGVLLLTNDGELTQKLAHPAYEVKKVYEVRLDKDLTKKDFDQIIQGVTLEDGLISPDALAYADTHDKSVIGIEIHSGKNRIVRRIFEHLGYTVKNLDRVMYAGLTKKNVDRGKWRLLSEKEVRLLKYLNTSFTRKK